MKEPNNEVDKNAVAVVRTNCHCKEEVVWDALYGLLLGVSAIEMSVLGHNVNGDLKMMSTKEKC